VTIEFRYAGFGEYQKISRFLDTYWAKDHVYVRMPHLFKWTFSRKKLWDHGGYSFALAEDKGEIVGILGGIPFVFNCFGQVSEGIWTANYMVRPDYRRGPFALRLLDMLHRPPYHTFIVFGADAAVLRIYRALRGQILSEIPRHFAVLPGGVDRMTNLICLAYPHWPVRRAYELAQAVRVIDLRETIGKAEKEELSQWNDHGWKALSAHMVGAARDLDYLTWRYVDHPCFTYHFICLSDGDHIGLAVWRLETIRRATPQGLVEVDRIGRLVEFLPASRGNAQELLSHFWRALSEADAFGADYYGYHGESRLWLQDLGFHNVKKHADGPSIPSRFQPLEPQGATIQSAIFVPDQVPACSPDLTCNWYWTKSDADQDRPN
jgi:hypothetical protein